MFFLRSAFTPWDTIQTSWTFFTTPAVQNAQDTPYRVDYGGWTPTYEATDDPEDQRLPVPQLRTPRKLRSRTAWGRPTRLSAGEPPSEGIDVSRNYIVEAVRSTDTADLMLMTAILLVDLHHPGQTFDLDKNIGPSRSKTCQTARTRRRMEAPPRVRTITGGEKQGTGSSLKHVPWVLHFMQRRWSWRAYRLSRHAGQNNLQNGLANHQIILLLTVTSQCMIYTPIPHFYTYARVGPNRPVCRTSVPRVDSR